MWSSRFDSSQRVNTAIYYEHYRDIDSVEELHNAASMMYFLRLIHNLINDGNVKAVGVWTHGRHVMIESTNTNLSTNDCYADQSLELIPIPPFEGCDTEEDVSDMARQLVGDMFVESPEMIWDAGLQKAAHYFLRNVAYNTRWTSDCLATTSDYGWQDCISFPYCHFKLDPANSWGSCCSQAGCEQEIVENLAGVPAGSYHIVQVYTINEKQMYDYSVASAALKALDIDVRPGDLVGIDQTFSYLTVLHLPGGGPSTMGACTTPPLSPPTVTPTDVPTDAITASTEESSSSSDSESTTTSTARGASQSAALLVAAMLSMMNC